MTSAFAAAAQAAQPATSPAAAPTTNPLPFNANNPFANASNFGGSGNFTPAPPLDALVGRTVIYIPRAFNPAAPDPFNPGGTRAQWTADLYVLTGGRLSFWHKQKGDPNATPPTQDTQVERVQEDVSPTNPYVSLGTLVSQASFVRKLQGASDARQFLVASPFRGAMKAQRERGMTDAQVQAEHAAWITANKAYAEPKFVWLLGDGDMDAALAWWAVASGNVKL